MNSLGNPLRMGALREDAYFAQQDQILLANLREVLLLQAEVESVAQAGNCRFNELPNGSPQARQPHEVAANGRR
jgi:hypothetical protein